MLTPLDKAATLIMWEEMGWKESAETEDVVLAIRNFYTSQLSRVNKEDMNEPESALSQSQEDEWAIGCINNHELRPLHEALDTDCSNFVTIHKLNEFTAARPSDWSLPLWLAYWTTGFEVTLRQYTSRIRIELYRISSVYSSLDPKNAGTYSRLLNSDNMQLRIDRIVAGIHMLPSKGPGEYLHYKFREYAEKVENHIKKELGSCGYFIKKRNTLSLIIGPGGRLEEYALPLIYLILRRIRFILTEGKKRGLYDAHFGKPLTSLNTLWSVIRNRDQFLKGAFKLRNLDLNEELRRYCYAMHYFVAIESSHREFDASETSYYNRPDGCYDVPISNLNGEKTTLKTDNLKGTYRGDEPVDMDSSLKVSAELEISIINEQSQGLNDVWHGFYSPGFHSDDFYGIVEFRIDHINEDNTFTATGTDSVSPFTIEGKWNERRVSFWAKYDSQFIRNHPSKTGRFYTGNFNDSLDGIVGNWGDLLLASTKKVQAKSSGNDEDEENSEIQMSGFLGRFRIFKKRVEYIRFRPSDEEFKENKPRAYWKFALNAVIDSVSKRVFTWSNLKRRRNTRYRFISLWIWNKNQNFKIKSNRDEYYMLRKELSAVEFRLYHHLAQEFRSRTVQHRIFCNHRKKMTISATRYMCLTCSAGHYLATVNICGGCIDKQFTVFRKKGEQNRVPSHTLLQIRRPFALRDQYRARRAAETTLNAHNPIQESSGILCSVCKRLIEERPYWSCCVCEGLFVCHACNSEFEKRQPWLYEIKKNEDIGNSHHWSHDLVLIANPEPSSLSLSVEEPTDIAVQQIRRALQDIQLKERSRPVNQLIRSNGDTSNQTMPPNRDAASSNGTSASQALQTAYSNVNQTSYHITIINNSWTLGGASTSSNTEH